MFGQVWPDVLLRSDREEITVGKQSRKNREGKKEDGEKETDLPGMSEVCLQYLSGEHCSSWNGIRNVQWMYHLLRDE